MDHRYQIGDQVSLAGGTEAVPEGVFKIIYLLPTRTGGSPQYRVFDRDGREHVVSEFQIMGSGQSERQRSSHNPITNELNRLRRDEK